MRFRRSILTGLAVGLAVAAAGCGGGSSSSSSSGGSGTTSSSSTGGGGKGGTFTILANSNWGTADPAKNYTLQEWQLLILTHDGLVGFKRAAGAEGTKIVADLATEVPQPTDDGKTWTFTLRPGIKYSDGTDLKASDFETVFKRQFTVPGPASGFYESIDGAENCLKSAKTCDLSKGVVADDSAGTVTFHLTNADPEFLDKLGLPFAFAVPGNTALKDTGNDPPPGTGPYMWDHYDPNKDALLVRNPNFKEWSAEAQPDGNPDQILYKFGLTVEAEVTQVENGQADWVFDPPPADRLNEISTKYADQAHVNPLTADYYMALNVNVPPFDNLKARQAANFAADRAAYVKIYGGPSLAQPSCQVLPPNFPGYEPYCPYTTDPGDGAWHGPDIAKATQLVEESGTKGAKVSVVGTTDEVGKALTEQVVADLNKIGYKASAKLLAGGVQYPYIQNSDNKVQVGYSQWYQDYPAASDFLNILLGCGSYHPGSDASPNISGFCDDTIQGKMNDALEKGLTDPEAANEIWAEVDRDVTDQGAWIEMFNPKLIDFVSTRVSGYQFSPQWYFLIGQASVQ
jgi:peptide/nickel transport system substrate-binding protein